MANSTLVGGVLAACLRRCGVARSDHGAVVCVLWAGYFASVRRCRATQYTLNNEPTIGSITIVPRGPGGTVGTEDEDDVLMQVRSYTGAGYEKPTRLGAPWRSRTRFADSFICVLTKQMEQRRWQMNECATERPTRSATLHHSTAPLSSSRCLSTRSLPPRPLTPLSLCLRRLRPPPSPKTVARTTTAKPATSHRRGVATPDGTALP